MSSDDDLPFAMQSSSRRADSTPLTAVDTERLLDGHGAHREAPAMQHAIAGLLDSAAGPANDQELAGEAAAVAAFVQATERSRSARFRVRARPGQAIAAGIAAAVVFAFSGAAVANALPAPIQELAHTTFGAPAPQPSAPLPKATAPSGPLPKATVPSGRPAPAVSSGSRHGKARAVGKKASPKALPHGKAKGKEGHPARPSAPGHQQG